MKKLWTAVLSVTAALLLLVGGTYSWFYSDDSKENSFSVAHTDVRLNEVFEGDYGQKEVVASNVGDMPALVRLAAIPVITKVDEETGNEVQLPITVDGQSIIRFVRPGSFATYWMDGDDGWYYYKRVLKAGEETSGDARFLLRVDLVPGFDYEAHPEYIGATLDVDVKISSVAVSKTGDYLSVWGVNSDVRDMLAGICQAYYQSLLPTAKP